MEAVEMGAFFDLLGVFPGGALTDEWFLSCSGCLFPVDTEAGRCAGLLGVLPEIGTGMRLRFTA